MSARPLCTNLNFKKIIACIFEVSVTHLFDQKTKIQIMKTIMKKQMLFVKDSHCQVKTKFIKLQ